MTRKSAVAGVVLAAWLVVPVWAEERERTMPTRGFDQFELESETVTGFWAEAGALYERTVKEDATVLGFPTADNLDLDTRTAFARFAFGGNDKWEAGAFIPYSVVKGDVQSTPELKLDENGIGDVQLSGKYVPIRSGLLDLGAGADVSLPTGDQRRGLGTGELGGMPFVTGAIHLAVADIRAHVGDEFFTSKHHGQAASRIIYGFGIFLPMGKYAALRNEFSGLDVYDLRDGPRVVNYLPGLDFRIPIGSLDLLLRITGAVGVTTQAPTWGVGGSLVLTSPTMRVPPAKGGVVVE